MSTETCSHLGITLAFLLVLSWPTAYFVSRLHGEVGNLAASHRWVDPRRQVVRSDSSCAPSEHPPRAFRMGIDSDYPPFSREIAQ